jgi:hypothetical protein
LREGKAACNEATCDYCCECFEVFHNCMFYWFDLSALATLCRTAD